MVEASPLSAVFGGVQLLRPLAHASCFCNMCIVKFLLLGARLERFIFVRWIGVESSILSTIVELPILPILLSVMQLPNIRKPGFAGGVVRSPAK